MFHNARIMSHIENACGSVYVESNWGLQCGAVAFCASFALRTKDSRGRDRDSVACFGQGKRGTRLGPGSGGGPGFAKRTDV